MGLLEDMEQTALEEEATVIGDPVIESEIVLTAIREECDSDKEFADLMEDAAIEMSLYGVIDDADAALEVAKRIVIKDYKSARFNRVEKRTALRLAMKSNDTKYKQYKKYRAKMIAARNEIFHKYGARAKSESRKIIQNSRRKASNINSKSGSAITDKIDKQIKKATIKENNNFKKQTAAKVKPAATSKGSKSSAPRGAGK
jgi:hypothetical protein